MEEISLQLGSKVYLLEIAESEEDHYDGLAAYDYIGENEGMFFIFDTDGSHGMVMRGVEFPIDILHLSQEGLVNSINTAEPGDPALFQGTSSTRYVIEILAGQVAESGVKEGDIIEIPSELDQYLADKYAVGMAKKGGTPTVPKESRKKYDVKTTDIPEKSDHLQILDHDGKVLSNIKMGARIFSRPHTEQLIKVAEKGESPENLKQLGLMMVEMIHKQNTQPPEYSN